MKLIARFGLLVLVLALISSPALALTLKVSGSTSTSTCPKVAAATCTTTTCVDRSDCADGVCPSGANCVKGAACPKLSSGSVSTCPKVSASKPAYSKPTVTVTTGSTCPNVTKKPTATKKPVATKKPEATAKPVATKKPAATAKPVATAKPAATKAPAIGSSMSSAASSVISQTNAERAKQGLGSLSVSSELNRAAAVRAKEIVQKFSHTRPDGSAWSTVSSAVRGENIAMGQQTADKVMAAWMSSSGHRANILRASFGSIGVAAYKVGNTMYWVQLFGA